MGKSRNKEKKQKKKIEKIQEKMEKIEMIRFIDDLSQALKNIKNENLIPNSNLAKLVYPNLFRKLDEILFMIGNFELKLKEEKGLSVSVAPKEPEIVAISTEVEPEEVEEIISFKTEPIPSLI